MTDHHADPSSSGKPDIDRLLHRRKGMSGTEFAGAGVQFAGTIVAFALAGAWLDQRFGTSPWLILVLVFGGSSLGFWSLYRRAVKSQQKDQKDT